MDFQDKTSVTGEYETRTLRDQSDISAGGSPVYDSAPAYKLIAKHRALSYPYVCKFGSAVLEIQEEVFCPTLANASRLLLDTILFESGERVLDVFSGSGAFGINAALAGGTVVTVDISDSAVASTKRNAALNHVEDRIDIRLGALEECVWPGETFDLIIANPPLLPGEQSDPLAASIFDPGLRATVGFVRTVGNHLKTDGRCYLVTSDVIERCGYDIDRLCFESGLNSYIAAKLDVGYETYRVHEITLDRTNKHRIAPSGAGA